ncbi:MAG: hypothetical protein E7273_10625 [Pseudobutyrivibrio ruminis]|nr:hypothetical protein [Pseudobutyrivibrio ruminis]
MRQDLQEELVIDAFNEMNSHYKNGDIHPMVHHFINLISLFSKSIVIDGNWNIDYYVELRKKSRLGTINPSKLQIDEWLDEFNKSKSYGHLYRFLDVADGEELSFDYQQKMHWR